MFRDTIAITNRQLVENDYLEQIKIVVSHKPYALILREKDLTEKEYEELAGKVLRICEQQNVTCYLHSHARIALELKCKNIHFSIEGLQENRYRLDDFEHVSVSCHSIQDVKTAIEYGANQIILGTIFETECKKGLKGRGVEFVQEVAEYCNSYDGVEVFAIGGITPDNLSLVKEAGARGGCMMSYMMKLSS